MKCATEKKVHDSIFNKFLISGRPVELFSFVSFRENSKIDFSFAVEFSTVQIFTLIKEFPRISRRRFNAENSFTAKSDYSN